ncbi:TetR/AcrR family transcriptional regulator [Pectobacterium zantedeschiae]|uniref:TetR/AcrR family transcriptional regulator n=1 Tax=Pectobacterium zantedeschiae TaxID=2034769 RepID=A0A9X8JHX3_9GAMM|nr:TetR/AcrR family transcriptional regulator [Pectobacterium zantedeschiae]RYC43325.1 TetR family transcriptional regulator [Pectobacterium zantedeschiae]RYC44063.1 TetR/AcrR family transcriptional regulator [Pectobacterium zantedeschiae]RYC48717.1 TetR family transcriptional regulator [Pectobacterium zantedeschiae]
MSLSTRSGRPRSNQVTTTVLKAALNLAKTGGISYATIERISQCTGVAKSTIYRRWPNASAIVMDAFLQDIGPLILYEKYSSITDTVRTTLYSLVDALTGERGELLRHLLGLAQFETELQEAFLQRWIMPRRQLGLRALKQAIESKDLSPKTDPELILDMLYGAIYYRLVVSFEQPDTQFMDNLVDRVFHGLLCNNESPAVEK